MCSLDWNQAEENIMELVICSLKPTISIKIVISKQQTFGTVTSWYFICIQLSVFSLFTMAIVLTDPLTV